MSFHLSAMNCHYRFYELEYFFKTIQKIGFHYCEIWTSPHHFYVDYQKHDDVKKLKDLAKQHDVEIVCICPEQTNPKPNNIACKDKKRQEDVYHYFCNMIDIAKEINCNKVLVTAGWAYYSESKDEAYMRSVSMMKKICAYAEKQKVYLALEALQPQESILVTNCETIKNYIKMVGSEYLKVCIDMGAMAKANETLFDYFETFGKNIIHIHFVDGKPTGHLAWGDGERDMKSDLEILEKYGYDGYLSLENATERYYKDPQRADLQNMEEFKKHWGKEGER